VEAVAAPSADTHADLMFTVTADLHDHYRMWVEQGFLRCEEKTAALGKQAVGDLVPFDATTHAFWRIRHDAITDAVMFETAPRLEDGSPGAWQERGEIPRAFDLTAVRVELKAGTWQPETVAPGNGTFDRVKVVR
jgi:hypothetical protein